MVWKSLQGTLFLAFGLLACTTERGKSCEQHSQCVAARRASDAGDAGVGSYCSNEGHCTKECVDDKDCPCGSICAATCGVCLGIDLDAGVVKRATCFTASVEFSEILSACRGDLSDLAGLAERAARPLCAPAAASGCNAGGYLGISLAFADAGDATTTSDASHDASSEAGTDASGDAANDASSDAGGDAATDASSDAGADVGGDAGKG